MTAEESSKSSSTRNTLLTYVIFVLLLIVAVWLANNEILSSHQFFVVSEGITAGFFMVLAVRNIPSRMIRNRTKAVILLSAWLALLGLGSLGFTEIIDYNLSAISLLGFAITAWAAAQLFVNRVKKTEKSKIGGKTA